MNAFKAYILADQKQGAPVKLITEFVIFLKRLHTSLLPKNLFK